MTRTLADMTPGKWSVTRYEGGKSWRVWDGDDDYQGTYSTWEAAMRHADRGARTSTVTLPRNVKRVTVGPKTWMELRDDGGVTLHAEETSIGIRKTHLEEATLALLAHVRRMA